MNLKIIAVSLRINSTSSLRTGIHGGHHSGGRSPASGNFDMPCSDSFQDGAVFLVDATQDRHAPQNSFA
jgi:hypothetical protein